MSRIDELVERLCPEGVEYRVLGEVFDIRNGYTPSKRKPEYWQDGTVPWFRMEDIRENGRVLDTALRQVNRCALKQGRAFPANSLIVATSATIGEHALITVDFLCNQRFTCLMLKKEYKERLNMRFLFHYCFVLDEWCKANTHNSSFASVDMQGFTKFRIPVPPMEVQEEVVRVLDSFAELEAELEAELTARRRQYAYYRDQLLDFTEREDVPWLTLGEVCPIGRGDYITKKDIVKGDVPVILGGTEPAYYHAISNHEGKGIVVSRSGVNAGFISWWNGPIFVSDGFVLSDSGSIDFRFLYHFLKKHQGTLNSMKRGSGVPHINSKMLENYPIPLPPLAEQERIVSILDRFDALTTSLTDGLPAEIAAHRKQYAHYRDRLLAFPERTCA